MCVFLSAVEEASTSGFCHGSRQTARQTVHPAAQLELPDNTTTDIIYVFVSIFFGNIAKLIPGTRKMMRQHKGGLAKTPPAADIISP